MNKDSISPTRTKILIVDDIPANRTLLAQTLEPEGYDVLLVPNGEVALNVVRRVKPELILLDIMMPGIDGFDTCGQLKQDEATKNIPIIFITAKDDTASMVQGFHVGGVDYITRPFEGKEVLVRVETHLKIHRLTQELLQKNRELQNEIARREQAEEKLEKAGGQLSLISQQEAQRWGIDSFVGKSKTVENILNEVRQLQNAGTTNVLIAGESGTGKELVARAIHFGGTRAKGPFIPLNCSAIPHELAESTLFGHIRGAFTGAHDSRKGYFELADGGTLFLDEIGDMSHQLQAKLLRVLEDGCITPVGSTREKHVDVRIMSATNQNLQAKIAKNAFRRDLYFRLAQFTVTVPPLRERPEDIPLLAHHFLKLFATEMGIEKPALSPAILSELQSYSFPGNVRELKNIIEHALIKSGGSVIQLKHLHLIVPDGIASPAPQQEREISAPAQPQTDEDRILAYLQQHDNINNADCRDLLDVDIHRASYLLRKMHSAGLLTRQGGHRWAQYSLP